MALHRRVDQLGKWIKTNPLHKIESPCHILIRGACGNSTKEGVAVVSLKPDRDVLRWNCLLVARGEQEVLPTPALIIARRADIGLRGLPRIEQRPEHAGSNRRRQLHYNRAILHVDM